MKKFFVLMLLAVASLSITTTNALAQNNPKVGGAAMYSTKDIRGFKL